MLIPLAVALLPACGGPADTGAPSPADDTGGDTGDTAAPGLTGLADADATFVGEPSSAVGSAVSGAGDLDGDGRADVLVSAFYANRACVWYAPADGEHALAEGACLAGEVTYDFAGYDAAAVAFGAGPAIAVSAIGNDDAGIEAGKVYLARGAIAAGSTPLATLGVAWLGEAAGDYAGTSVADAGDTDGDGASELLVGASGVDAGGSGGGRVYLLPDPGADGVYGLGDAYATFTGSGGTPPAFAHGASTGGDALGEAVAGLGDIDGDGFGDILLGGGGSDAAGQDSGEAWIVRGPIAGGDHVAADADARLLGEGAGAFAGAAVAGPGDLDGDGLSDALVTADAWEEGRVYVLFGPIADGAYGLDAAPTILAGENAEDVAGWAVAGAGDTDGDGRREVIVGAPGYGDGDDGAVYLVRDATRPGVIALAEATRLDGEAPGDAAGRAVAGAGDTDGDGLDDLLVGALYNQTGGVFAGKGYLLRGR